MPQGRAFNPQQYQKQQQKRAEDKLQQDQKKSKGGWFSCFSSTADESKQSNMMSQQQLERRQQIEEIEQYNRQMDMYAQNNNPNDLLDYNQNANQRTPQRNMGGQNGGRPENDLNRMRAESKARLRQGLPYQPDNSMLSGPTLSATRTPKHSTQKDLSYYAGSRAERSSSAAKGRDSNLRLGQKLENYSANKASMSNLMNTSNVSGTRNYDQNQNMNQAPSYSKVQYRGRGPVKRQQQPEQFQQQQQRAPQQNDRFYDPQYEQNQNLDNLNNVLNDNRRQKQNDNYNDRPVVVSTKPIQNLPKKKLHNQQSNPFNNVVSAPQQNQYQNGIIPDSDRLYQEVPLNQPQYDQYQDPYYDQEPNFQKPQYRPEPIQQQQYRPEPVQQVQIQQQPQFDQPSNFHRRRKSQAQMEDDYEMEQEMIRKNNSNKKRPGSRQSFWTQQVISQSMNDAVYMRSNFVASLAKGRPGFGAKKMSMREEQNLLAERYDQINQKYQQMSVEMYQDLDMEYETSQRYRDAGSEEMTPEQFQEAKQEIHWDIAWQIFDEVNEYNDLDKFIDLYCLDLEDSIAICKQKLYDAAQEVNKNYQGIDQVLNIQCSNKQMVQGVDPYDGRQVAKNQIFEMVQNELQLDCNYQNGSMNLLVRIDQNTFSNPVLKEW